MIAASVAILVLWTIVSFFTWILAEIEFQYLEAKFKNPDKRRVASFFLGPVYWVFEVINWLEQP